MIQAVKLEQKSNNQFLSWECSSPSSPKANVPVTAGLESFYWLWNTIILINCIIRRQAEVDIRKATPPPPPCDKFLKVIHWQHQHPVECGWFSTKHLPTFPHRSLKSQLLSVWSNANASRKLFTPGSFQSETVIRNFLNGISFIMTFSAACSSS